MTKPVSTELSEKESLTPESAVLSGGRRPKDKTADSVPAQNIPNPQVKPRQPRRTFTKRYKLDVLKAYDGCNTPDERGALLRREGLYYSRITTWKKERDEGKFHSIKQRSTSDKINRQLQNENTRLKKKLEQAEAIIELQKKVSEILGTHILPPEKTDND